MDNEFSEDADADGYVRFGPVARSRMGEQCQYASRYIGGRMEGYPALGEGLRFKNVASGNYHNIRIHLDDIDEFVRRYREYEKSRLAGFGSAK